LGALLCVLLFAIPLGLLIGAAILRGAIGLANKVVGSASTRSSYDFDDDDEDDWDDVPRRRRKHRRASPAIPEPPILTAMGIILVIGIVNFLAGIPIRMMFGLDPVGRDGPEDAQKVLVAAIVSLPVGFLIMAAMLQMMLPTTFPRACLVVLFEYLIVLAIVLVITVPLFVLGLALRGGG
jgi:hypothetical protein